MGYMRAHAIIVDSWDEASIKEAHTVALRMFDGVAPVTEITPPAVNRHRSFMVAPDGSKEGWAESHAGDAARLHYKVWLREQSEADRLYLDWVEVMFADDDGAASVTAHSREGKG